MMNSYNMRHTSTDIFPSLSVIKSLAVMLLQDILNKTSVLFYIENAK